MCRIINSGRRRSQRSASRLLLWAAAIACLSGCTSIKSTFLTRDESNTRWQKHRHLHGIPITLKVPTHLKLYVFDKHYLELVEVNGVAEVVPLELDVVVRDFAQEFIYTEKIFTVDFKRPAAGTSNLRLEMTDEQYFAKIQHDVTDNTIEKVGALVKELFPDNRALFGNPVGGADAPKVKEIKSLVAVGVFDVDAPDLELQVMNFVNCHINKAHDAWVVPATVPAITRVPVGPNIAVPYPDSPLCPNERCLTCPPLHPLPPTGP